jgi:hypothetical protein
MALFDISDEIQLIDRALDEWNVEPEQLFYALRACGMIAVIVPVFEGERTERGCLISAYGKHCVHEIEISEGKVMLGSKGLDEENGINNFFVGPSDNPASWEGVIRHVFHHERAILSMADFKGRVRREWDEYLRIRGDRLGF